ncbi:unnamed protein product, partial [Didymodactylos carnosus]
NDFLAWGNGRQELSEFINYGLFPLPPKDNFDDVQQHFRTWYNRTHPHTVGCVLCLAQYHDHDDNDDGILELTPRFEDRILSTSFDMNDDHTECTCDHRPYKDPSQVWSLQRAVAV